MAQSNFPGSGQPDGAPAAAKLVFGDHSNAVDEEVGARDPIEEELPLEAQSPAAAFGGRW